MAWTCRRPGLALCSRRGIDPAGRWETKTWPRLPMLTAGWICWSLLAQPEMAIEWQWTPVVGAHREEERESILWVGEQGGGGSMCFCKIFFFPFFFFDLQFEWESNWGKRWVLLGLCAWLLWLQSREEIVNSISGNRMIGLRNGEREGVGWWS